jgi:hypothetical protein
MSACGYFSPYQPRPTHVRLPLSFGLQPANVGNRPESVTEQLAASVVKAYPRHAAAPRADELYQSAAHLSEDSFLGFSFGARFPNGLRGFGGDFRKCRTTF